MKKLLLSTLILNLGLIGSINAIDVKTRANQAPTQNQAATENQATNNTNPYLNDLAKLDKELTEAIKKGNVNPNKPQEDALKELDNQLGKFITEHCPITNNKHIFSKKISLDDALSILNKFESMTQALHTDFAKSDSMLAPLFPKQYSDDAKKAYKVIKNIQKIKKDINPSLYYTAMDKVTEYKKWALSSKKNFAITVASAMALNAFARFALKDYNGWIKPVIKAGGYIGSNIVVPTFKYLTWQ